MNAFGNNYYSIDDILLTQDKLPCRINVTIPKLGKIVNSTESDDIEEETKVELPLWLASQLTMGRYPILSIEMPKFFNESYRQILKADACVVNLNKLNINFYELGAYLKKFDKKNDVSETLTMTFQNRFRRLMDFSTYSKRNHKILEKFDNLERRLFQSNNLAQLKIQTWMHESRNVLTAADMVIYHRKRKRAHTDSP